MREREGYGSVEMLKRETKKAEEQWRNRPETTPGSVQLWMLLPWLLSRC